MKALEELKETNPTLALKMLSEAMFHIERAPPRHSIYLDPRDSESKKLLIFSTTFKNALFFGLMLLACHKKSYLISDKFTNFSMYKTETAKRAETSA